MSDDKLDEFELQMGFDDDRTVIAVRGEVDLLTAPALYGVLGSTVDAGCRCLVVDLSGCRFMDASGLGVLVGVGVRMKEAGGTITVRGANALILRILDLTHVSDFVRHEAFDTTSASLGPQQAIGRDVHEDTGRASAVPISPPAAVVRSSSDAVDAALGLVTALAAATVDNADGVSVTLERDGRLMTVAASNDKVSTMDRHQYETGEGPCLAAKAEGRWYYIESLDDETRWPTFVPLALRQGIHSILSSPLMTGRRAQGALNIYSSRQQAFGTHEQELAALFANQASEILSSFGPQRSSRQYGGAMTQRRMIHQAQGVIMARDDATADEAIRALFRAAEAAGVTAFSYATDLVASMNKPPDP